MLVLQDQAHFEALFRNPDPIWIPERGPGGIFFVYFTAAWCGPCRKLDKPAIVALCKEVAIPIYICDAEANEYTSGYCGVRKFPSFVAFHVGKQLDTLTSSNTEVVLEWIRSQTAKYLLQK